MIPDRFSMRYSWSLPAGPIWPSGILSIARARWQNERSPCGQEGHGGHEKNRGKGEDKIPVYKNLEFMKFREILERVNRGFNWRWKWKVRWKDLFPLTVKWRRKRGECFAYLVPNLVEIVTWEGQTTVYFGGKMQFSSNKCCNAKVAVKFRCCY